MSKDEIEIIAKSILDDLEIWDMSEIECWIDGFVRGYEYVQQKNEQYANEKHQCSCDCPACYSCSYSD